jgi:hypothetical protein
MKDKKVTAEHVKRGFALMDPELLRKVSSIGGKISVQSRREMRQAKQNQLNQH